MPLKCCVPRCKSNYTSMNTKVPVYTFPKDLNEQKKWINNIPHIDFTVTKYSAVCRLHWPDDAAFVTDHGKLRPVKPPSLFPNIPRSCLKEPLPKERKTLTSSFLRGIIPDEITEFEWQDLLSFNEIKTVLRDYNDIIVYKDENIFIIQSKLFKYGVPIFVLKIFDELTFESFSFGSSCSISSLSTNRAITITSKSALFEAIRYLKNKGVDHKSKILLEHLNVMWKKIVGNSFIQQRL